jgi:hypothetical protein
MNRREEEIYAQLRQLTDSDAPLEFLQRVWRCRRLSQYVWFVPSRTAPTCGYEVDVLQRHCRCKGRARNGNCSHLDTARTAAAIASHFDQGVVKVA